LVWGFLLPVVFATFGKEMGALARSGTFATAFDLLSRFTGGDVFSIRGTVALGLVHPIALALVTIQVVGFAAAAVAGERQRGTLEVLLARPLERRVLHLTMLAAMLLFAALTEAEQNKVWQESERLRWRGQFEQAIRAALPSAVVVGEGAERLWNTVSLRMPHTENLRWVTRLDKLGFQVSTGSACATGKAGPSPVLAAMGCTVPVCVSREYR